VSDRVDFSLTYGAITGYDKPVLPMLTPGLGVKLSESVGVRLMFLPGVRKGASSALHLAFEWQ
jgi:hypothetical protein